MAPPASLAHRATGSLPTGGLVVGPAAVDAASLRRAADFLYDGIERDRDLRPKFGSDLAGERRKLGALFVELFGGAPEWSRTYALGGLAGPHRHIHITAEDAGRWLGHARSAFEAAAGAEVARDAVARLRPLAMAMVNEAEPAAPKARREARFAPTRAAIASAGKGDLPTLLEVIDAHPTVIAPTDPGSAEVLHAAVARGRLPVVEALLERGIDVDKPAPVGIVLLTPWCTARARGRRGAPIAALLQEAGARDDVFTAAYLGDRDALVAWLDAEPALLAEPDPASDLFAATAVDHAAVGLDRRLTLALLAERGARSPAHGHLLLRHAAEAGDADAVGRLLAMGADARNVTPGRWVLDAACAPLLLAHGADVNHAPTRWASWIWQSCSGNQGAKDDPAFVRALLEAGADVHARAFGRTALHHAAKAGFPATVAALLAAGADPVALDDDGRTPTDLARAGRPSDRRDAVLRALAAAGAG